MLRVSVADFSKTKVGEKANLLMSMVQGKKSGLFWTPQHPHWGSERYQRNAAVAICVNPADVPDLTWNPSSSTPARSQNNVLIPTAKPWHVKSWYWKPRSLTSLWVGCYRNHLFFLENETGHTFIDAGPVPKVCTLGFFKRVSLKPKHQRSHQVIKKATNASLLWKQLCSFFNFLLARSLALGSVHWGLLY